MPAPTPAMLIMAETLTTNRGGSAGATGRDIWHPRTALCRKSPTRAFFDASNRKTESSHKASSRRKAGQAATISRQPLATYNWPEGRPDVLQWLEHSIKHAVEKLDKAPFLELVYPSKHDTRCSIYPVDESVVDSPQLWRGIAEHLSNSQPEIVILLHQLPPATESPQGAVSTGQWTSQQQGMFTGITAHQALNQNRLKYCSMLLRDGIAEGILAGKVGECCDGETENQILPFSREQHSQMNWDVNSQQQHTHLQSDQEEQLVDFWGLIVQSKYRSDAEGAYVLKTVRNSNPVGCQCTHYSLMRVCQGDLVKTHRSTAWLLNR